MKKNEIIKYLIIRTIGNFLVLLTLFGFFATFGPAVYFEFKYRLDEYQGVKYIVADSPQDWMTNSGSQNISEENKTQTQNITPDEKSQLGDILAKSDKEKILIPKSVEFALIIPKIGVSAKVFANVDATNPSEFLDVLQRGVAHAAGTVFPGDNGNIYLFAHSADNWWNVGRYNAIFYLLKELAPGDEVYLYFYGIRHNYVVTESKIVEANDIQYLSPNTGGGESLILQTCWPPGTTWKRQLVFARPK